MLRGALHYLARVLEFLVGPSWQDGHGAAAISETFGYEAPCMMRIAGLSGASLRSPVPRYILPLRNGELDAEGIDANNLAQDLPVQCSGRRPSQDLRRFVLV